MSELEKETLDGEWIKRRLKPLPRGTQANLARRLGINNDKMSKTIKGSREIQINEVIPLLLFFGYQIIPPDDEFGALHAQWLESAKEHRDVLRAAARGLRAEDQESSSE